MKRIYTTVFAALTAFCPALGAEIEGRIVSLAAPDGAGLVFCGLDDFPSSVPLGEQYAVTDERVNKNGVEMSLKRRILAMDGRTLHGRLNALLENFLNIRVNTNIKGTKQSTIRVSA